MPTMHREANWKVTVYAADHLPPHCHVLLSDGREALVDLATFKLITVGDKAVRQREIAEALSWIRANTTHLIRTFRELNP